MTSKLRPSLAIAAALLLGGCAQLQPYFDRTPPRSASHPRATDVIERDSAPPPREASRPRDRDRDRERDRDRDSAAAPPRDTNGLREGIQLYNDGDYNGAIRRLSARDVANGPLATRLAALKYTAFSYCVTSRPTQCRQAFDRALKLDPNFDLAPGEHGHPLWGPVFTRAKQSLGAR